MLRSVQLRHWLEGLVEGVDDLQPSVRHTDALSAIEEPALAEGGGGATLYEVEGDLLSLRQCAQFRSLGRRSERRLDDDRPARTKDDSRPSLQFVMYLLAGLRGIDAPEGLRADRFERQTPSQMLSDSIAIYDGRRKLEAELVGERALTRRERAANRYHDGSHQRTSLGGQRQ